MIAKQYRLTESQIGKVLRFRKPFFSNVMIVNVSDNRLAHPRFAIILSGKVAKTSVDRNVYRRKFYDLCAPFLQIPGVAGKDLVFVAKKGNIFFRRDEVMLQKFTREIQELLRKVL